MTDEHDDIPRSVRDFRLMARTGFWVVVGICTVIGALVAHVIHEERQDQRIEKIDERLGERIKSLDERIGERIKSLQDWQTGKDQAAAKEAERERWRAFRQQQQQPSTPFPGVERPKDVPWPR